MLQKNIGKIIIKKEILLHGEKDLQIMVEIIH